MAKQNKTKLYAQALAEVLSQPAYAKASAGEEKKIINNFVKVLVGAGLEKKAKEILELAEDLQLMCTGQGDQSMILIFLFLENISPLLSQRLRFLLKLVRNITQAQNGIVTLFQLTSRTTN